MQRAKSTPDLPSQDHRPLRSSPSYLARLFMPSDNAPNGPAVVDVITPGGHQTHLTVPHGTNAVIQDASGHTITLSSSPHPTLSSVPRLTHQEEKKKKPPRKKRPTPHAATPDTQRLLATYPPEPSIDYLSTATDASGMFSPPSSSPSNPKPLNENKVEAADHADEDELEEAHPSSCSCKSICKGACLGTGAIISGLTTAANAGLAGFLIWSLVTNTNPFTLKNLIDEGLDAAPPEGLDLAWVFFSSSLAANLFTALDFLPKLPEILHDCALFLGALWSCNLKPSKKTLLNIGAVGASGGAAAVMALISESTWKDVKSRSYESYLALTALTVSMGSLMMIGSRYSGGREIADSKESAFSKEDWALTQMLTSLEKAALDLQNKIHISTPGSQSTIGEHKLQIDLESKDAQASNINIITEQVAILFAQHNLSVPTNLKEIIEHAYNNGILSLKNTDDPNNKTNFWHKIYIGICCATGWIAYTLKFGTLNATLTPDGKTLSFESPEDIAKIAAKLFVGIPMCSTTGFLYAITAEKAFGVLKDLGKHSPLGKFLVGTTSLVNITACPSMFTVGYKVALQYRLPSQAALAFGILNAVGAWNINTRSCARIALAMLKLKDEKLPRKTRKKIKQQLKADLGQELEKFVDDYVSAKEKLGTLKKRFLDQKKPLDQQKVTDAFVILNATIRSKASATSSALFAAATPKAPLLPPPGAPAPSAPTRTL